MSSTAKKVMEHEVAEQMAAVITDLKALANRATSLAEIFQAFTYEDDVVDPAAVKELAWWADHSQGLSHAAAVIERKMTTAKTLLRAVELVQVHDESSVKNP